MLVFSRSIRSILHLKTRFFVQRSSYSLFNAYLFNDACSRIHEDLRFLGKKDNCHSIIQYNFRLFSKKPLTAEIDKDQNQPNDSSGEAYDGNAFINQGKRYSVFMRGLPYNVKSEDVFKFFMSSNIKPCQVMLKYDSYGQPNGKAQVFFEYEDEVQKALTKHNCFIGHRYVELSTLPFPQMDAKSRFFTRKNVTDVSGNYSTAWDGDLPGFWVRLSGLPFEASSEDIYEFFKPLNIVPNIIEFKYTKQGHPNGICAIKFDTQQEAVLALKNNNHFIGNRYIKVSLLRDTLQQLQKLDSL